MRIGQRFSQSNQNNRGKLSMAELELDPAHLQPEEAQSATQSEVESVNDSPVFSTSADLVNKPSPTTERAELINLETPILQRLQHNGPLLSPAESQISEYMLNYPRQVLRLPIDQLARTIGVSLGSLSNFCQTLGYSGFKEFKLDLAAELKSPFQLDYSSIGLGDSLEEIANKVVSANVDALLTTLKTLDKAELEKAIKAIGEAQRIDLYGFGISAVVALDAYHRFFSLGLRVNWLSDISLQAVSATLLRPGDVALAFSYAGETGVTINALQQARQNGACTIVITGNRHSPLARHGDIVLQVSPREPGAFRRGLHVSARTAMQGLVDVIYFGLLHSSKESLEKLRQAHQAVDDLRNQENS